MPRRKETAPPRLVGVVPVLPRTDAEADADFAALTRDPTPAPSRIRVMPKPSIPGRAPTAFPPLTTKRRIMVLLEPEVVDVLDRLAGSAAGRDAFLADLIMGAGLGEHYTSTIGDRLDDSSDDAAHLLIEGRRVYIRTPWDPECIEQFIEEIKTVDGRRWNAAHRAWSVPIRSGMQARAIVARYFPIETDLGPL